MTYTVVIEDGYIKVRHPKHGTVAAGYWRHGKVSGFEFLEDRYRNANAIRIPATKALAAWLINRQNGRP